MHKIFIFILKDINTIEKIWLKNLAILYNFLQNLHFYIFTQNYSKSRAFKVVA